VSDLPIDPWPDEPPPDERRRPAMVAVETRIETAVNYMVAGNTVRDTARRVGVHPDTVRRWLKTPRAQIRLAEAELALSEQAVRSFRSSIPKALATLKELLNPTDAMERTVKHADRIRAAEVVLRLATSNPHVLKTEAAEDPDADAEDAVVDKVLAIAQRLDDIDIVDAEIVEGDPE
jgi:transposase-like protein